MENDIAENYATSVLKELTTVKHNQSILYTFFRQYVSSLYGQLQVNNMKFIKNVVHTVLKDIKVSIFHSNQTMLLCHIWYKS